MNINKCCLCLEGHCRWFSSLKKFGKEIKINKEVTWNERIYIITNIEWCRDFEFPDKIEMIFDIELKDKFEAKYKIKKEFVCHICGGWSEYKCERCEKWVCNRCSVQYTQHNQVDYTLCEKCKNDRDT